MVHTLVAGERALGQCRHHVSALVAVINEKKMDTMTLIGFASKCSDFLSIDVLTSKDSQS